MCWVQKFVIISIAYLLGASFCAAAEEPIQSSVVFIQAGYEDNNAFIPVEEGTGFIVQESGWVITAKHVLTAAVPEGKVRAFQGSVRSRYGEKYPLFEVPGPLVSSDFGLLRFPPGVRDKWPALKVLFNHQFSASQSITAFGFPIGQEITVKPGVVTDIFGPNGAIGTNAGLAPGMSGGPVAFGATRCVVGIVAGGSNYPGFDWFSPTFLAKTLLDVAPAQACDESDDKKVSVVPHPRKVVRVCMGNGEGVNCLSRADAKYNCDTYNAMGGGAPRTYDILADRFCGYTENGVRKVDSHSIIVIQDNGGGQCGWTGFEVTCNP